jgi:hypothetical protein
MNLVSKVTQELFKSDFSDADVVQPLEGVST